MHFESVYEKPTTARDCHLVDYKSSNADKKTSIIYSGTDHAIACSVFLVAGIATGWAIGSVLLSLFAALYTAVPSFYLSMRDGAIKYECTVLGSAIQTAECHIMQSTSMLVHFWIFSFLEYVSNLFKHMNANPFDCAGRLCGAFFMARNAALVVAFLLKSIIRRGADLATGAYVLLLDATVKARRVMRHL